MYFTYLNIKHNPLLFLWNCHSTIIYNANEDRHSDKYLAIVLEILYSIWTLLKFSHSYVFISAVFCFLIVCSCNRIEYIILPWFCVEYLCVSLVYTKIFRIIQRQYINADITLLNKIWCPASGYLVSNMSINKT